MVVLCIRPTYRIVIITMDSRHGTARDQAEKVIMFYLYIQTLRSSKAKCLICVPQAPSMMNSASDS